MLAAPRLKLFYRCGEPESARWISDTIGEVEIERPRIGTTASVEDKGRDSLNYATVTEQKAVISKEQIMALPDLHGYWKYGDVVVPFRLPLVRTSVVAQGYIPRAGSIGVMDPPCSNRPNVGAISTSPAEIKKGPVSDRQSRTKTHTGGNTPHPDQRKFEYTMPQTPEVEAALIRPEAVVDHIDSPVEIGIVDAQLEEVQTDYT
jgi:hypothetical protein